MGYSNPRPQTKLERDLERWQKAFFEFMRLNGTRNSSAQHLLELYADLMDKKAEPSQNYENSPIWFHVTHRLTKSELLYAIETTFALNNLEITGVEENRVRLGARWGQEKAFLRRMNSSPIVRTCHGSQRRWAVWLCPRHLWSGVAALCVRATLECDEPKN